MNTQRASCPPTDSSRFPLAPRPVASLRCLLGRLDRIYHLLRKRGFSDCAALSGRDAALAQGMTALETGRAERMSAKQRAGWLWTLAKRAALRAARQEMARVSLTYDPEDGRTAAVDHQCLSEMAVQQAIARLPQQQRTAVTLCIMQDFTRAEAARAMGIRVSTVCCRLQAAFIRLRKDLAALAPNLIPGETAAGR